MVNAIKSTINKPYSIIKLSYGDHYTSTLYQYNGLHIIITTIVAILQHHNLQATSESLAHIFYPLYVE